MLLLHHINYQKYVVLKMILFYLVSVLTVSFVLCLVLDLTKVDLSTALLRLCKLKYAPTNHSLSFTH